MRRHARQRIPVSRLMSPVSNTADLLMEIGTEELPAAYLPGLIEQLGAEARALLEAHHLPFQTVQSFGTPRRLVLIVRGLAGTQRKPGEEVRGPSKQVAYDGAGKPTKALVGFLRSQGGALGQVKIVASEKGEYVYLVKPPTAIPTAKMLPDLLPQLVGKLRSPKTMRWDASGARFARPIRWLLALYGSTKIRCSLGRLTSGALTCVGGPLRPKPVAVRSIEQYLRALRSAGIILEPEARRAWIERAVARIATRSHGQAAPEMVSHGLLDEVTHLVEHPVALAGQFDPRYLVLPREVLLASMAKYQRVFTVEGRGARGGGQGKILPKFVAILEGTPRKPAQVRRIIERILNARLADSLMFWTEDHTRLPLGTFGRLQDITFHERLGSMEEKTQRLSQLSQSLADAWQLTQEERKHLERACLVGKFDLLSAMVKEFPTLQGVVGNYYARDSEEPQEVANAIEEHYLPIAGRLPKTLIGAALAILDKYDTLSSYFGIGIQPTGDQDPFGLRRAAQGIVEVAWKVHRPLPLESLFSARSGMDPFRTVTPKERAAVGERIIRYLLERLYTFAWPAPPSAPSVDCIDAVLGSRRCDDLVDVMDRIQSLQRLNGNAGLLKAAKVIERTRNILKGASLRQPQVDPARLTEPPERRLWDLYRSNEPRLVELTRQKSYTEATTLFGDVFFEPLHQFFDQVLVNTPEESLQQNRLALMQAINTLYTDRIADLSKLIILQHKDDSSD